MKTAFFTKRTHPKNWRKVNNGWVKCEFSGDQTMRQNVRNEPIQTQSDSIRPDPTESN
jgi:hypothetical protein